MYNLYLWQGKKLPQNSTRRHPLRELWKCSVGHKAAFFNRNLKKKIIMTFYHRSFLFFKLRPYAIFSRFLGMSNLTWVKLLQFLNHHFTITWVSNRMQWILENAAPILNHLRIQISMYLSSSQPLAVWTPQICSRVSSGSWSREEERGDSILPHLHPAEADE